MTNQTTPELLREIADVMEERPEDGFREFEFRMLSMSHNDYDFQVCGPDWEDIFRQLSDADYEIRRRPRTIKVSGEVPEHLRESAERVIYLFEERGMTTSEDNLNLARALLDLIEQSGGE